MKERLSKICLIGKNYIANSRDLNSKTLNIFHTKDIVYNNPKVPFFSSQYY